MSIRTSLTIRRLAAGLYGVRTLLSGVAALLLSLFIISSSCFAETVLFADSTGHRELVDTQNPGRFAMPKGSPTQQVKATSTTFNIMYLDVEQNTGIGFDDPAFGAARRNTVQLALDYIDSVINETGTCDIMFDVSEINGPGYLSAAGTFFDSLPGFSNGHAFYHITTGVDPLPFWPDIYVIVDFGWNWNTGSGAPSPSEFDLLSVMIHEFTHGLGLLSLSDESGQDPGMPGVFTHWDKSLETGNGNDLWDDGAAIFVGQPAWLLGQDGGVVFVGPNAVAAYGAPPPIYAPWPWEQGSSLSHFDLWITGGAVMEPAISPGVMKREYALVEVGALRDIGYTNTPGLPEVDFTLPSYTVQEGDAAATIAVQLSSAPGLGRTVQVNYTTSGATAITDIDYTGATGTLIFSDTDTLKTFAIEILDDTVLEGDEQLILTLVDSVGIMLGETNNPAVLTILDDDPDTDHDGISDYDEQFTYGTDQTKPDTDADGLPDGWEIRNGLDPREDGTADENNGPDGDPDGDEHTNLKEYAGGSDPMDENSIPGDLLWSTFIGGTGYDEAAAIAADSLGAVYVTGSTASADFATPGLLTRDSVEVDAFVMKLGPDGTSVVYWSYIGGEDNDHPTCIDVDSTGAVRLGGRTASEDFPITAGDTYAGSRDGFIVKLDPSGSISYSTYIGGSGSDRVCDIALDASEESLYFVGTTDSPDLPTSSNAWFGTLAGDNDVFVGKLGNQPYLTYFGGSDDEGADWVSIAVNEDGEAFVAGATYSNDFPTAGDPPLDDSFGGDIDAFVTRLNPDGSDAVFSTYLGGSLGDGAKDIALDDSSNAYIVGATESDDFPVTGGVVQPAMAGVADAFVAKLAADGATILYATYLGGEASDVVIDLQDPAGTIAVAVGDSGMAYVTGYTESADFPTTPDAFDTVLGGFSDAFLSVLSSGGTRLAYSTYIGGEEPEYGSAVWVDRRGDVFLVGATNSTDFPITGGAFDEVLNSQWDGFVAKLDLFGLIDPDSVTTPGHSESGLKKLNPCFIATAAYGTPAANEVGTLLEFRDGCLLTNRAGRAVVRTYYRLSPPVARFIEQHPAASRLVRAILAPVVWLASVAVQSTELFGATCVLAIALLLTARPLLRLRLTHRRHG